MTIWTADGIPVEVIRSARRTAAIEISPSGDVILRAGLRTSERFLRRFVAEHDGWIRTHRARVLARLAAHPEPTPEEEAALRARAKAVLPARVAYYASLMGVSPAAITVTGARTRFGSCSGKNRLSFSFRVMQYSDRAIDYVVVHELAHIRHHDHSPAFYAFVASVLPDWQSRARELRGDTPGGSCKSPPDPQKP